MSMSNDSVKPWHKRPSPYLLAPGMFLIAIVLGATFAPRLEVRYKQSLID